MTEAAEIPQPTEAKTPEQRIGNVVRRMRGNADSTWADFIRTDLKPETFEQSKSKRAYIMGMKDDILFLNLRKVDGKTTDEETVQSLRERMKEIHGDDFEIARTGTLSLDIATSKPYGKFIGDHVISDDIAGSYAAMEQLIEYQGRETERRDKNKNNKPQVT